MDAKKYAILCNKAYEDGFKSIRHHTYFIQDDQTDTQAYILQNAFEQIVMFRGTEISEFNLRDIETDLNIGRDCGIHRGFKESFESIAKDLKEILIPTIPTTYTGHSLGGALAMVASSYPIVPHVLCITFGAPRVFSKAQAAIYEELEGHKLVKYENQYDPVPFLPPYSLGYDHTGSTVVLKGKEQHLNPSRFLSGVRMFFTSTRTKLREHSIETYIDNLG